MMRAMMLFLAAILVSSCATTIPTNYVGTDAGYVVIGIGATSTTQYSSYSFLFRRAGEKETGRLVYFQNNIFYSRIPDYKTANEAGVVEIATLPPGRYELVNFNVFLNALMVPKNYSSRQDFSVPFEVRPKEIVYLGNYQANGIRGRLFGLPVAGGAFFVVEDRLRTDLGLAKARVASLPVENARNVTPDAKQIGNPFLVSTEQAKIARDAANPGVQSTPASGRN